MAFNVGTIEGRVKLSYDGRAFDKLEKDMRQAKRGVTSTIEVNEKLDKSTRRASGSMGSMGGVAAGLGSRMGGVLKAGAAGAALAIGTGLTVALKDAYTEAREAAKVTRLTANAIKASGGVANVTAKQVGDLANSLSEKTAIDDEAIQSSSNLLLTFRNIRNEAGKNNDIFNQATSTALDMAQAYGVDLPSATKMLGKALQDPASAASALKRTGAIDEAGVQRIKKMAENGASLLKMQKTLLNEVNKAGVQGAAAAAADPIQKLQIAYKNLMETVGLALLPYLQKAASALSKFITQMRTGKGTGGEFAKIIKEAWNNFKELWPAIRAVGQVIGFAIRHFKDLPGPVKSLFIPFGNIVRLMHAVIDVVKWMVKAFKNAISWLVNAWNNVADFFRRLPGRIATAMRNMGQVILSPFKWAYERIRSVLDRIIGVFRRAISKIKSVVGAVGGAVGAVGNALGFAEGGQVKQGTLFVAGERGPEWVINTRDRSVRKDNVGYLMQAASEMGIPMFARGGRTRPGRLNSKIEAMRTNMDLKRREFELSGGRITAGEFNRLIEMNKKLERALMQLVNASKGQAKRDARFALRSAQLDRRQLVAEKNGSTSDQYGSTPNLDFAIADLQTQLELAQAGYGGNVEGIKSKLKAKLEKKLALLRDRLGKTHNKQQIAILQDAISSTLGQLSSIGSGSGGPSIVEQVSTAAQLRFGALSQFGSNAMQSQLGYGGQTLARQGGTTVVLNGEFKLDSNDPHQSVRQLGHQIAQNLA